MTLCPVAAVAGCSKCPIVPICPLKGVIGNYSLPPKAEEKATGAKKSGPSGS